MAIIAVENLSKLYGESVGLKDASFQIEEGEMVGFIGPNGAGKSTTINILFNNIFPTSGHAEIFGKDVVKHSNEIKKMVGFVPSEVRYYPNITTMELFTITARFQRKDHSVKDIDRLCDIFEIDRTKKLSDLSLGNKKKTAIVSSLIANPKLLILDEPTNGLDPLIQKKLFQTLKECIESGTTVFLSSHNLSEVEEHCSRAIFIKNGTIIATENLKSAQKKAKLLTLFGCNVQNDCNNPKVKLLSASTDKTTLIFEGSFKEIYEFITPLNPADVTVENINLEHKFLSYYEEVQKQ